MATDPSKEFDFETLIREAAENPQNKPIPNSTDYHAFIAIKYLLKNAQTNVRIISSEFRETFWEKLLPDLNQFLSREGVKLNIVIQKIGNNNLANKLIEGSSAKVDIRQKISTNETCPDFLTIDSMGYRYETADDKKSLVQGIINFGDSSGTVKLNDFFVKVQKISNPYSAVVR